MEENKLKIIRMSIPEFYAYERNKCDIEFNTERLEKLIIFTVASIGFLQKNVSAAGNPLEKIDEAGLVFFGIIKKMSYWLCLIGCVLEILKIVMNGQSKDVGRIIIKYLLIFSTLYIVPWMFDLIMTIFA